MTVVARFACKTVFCMNAGGVFKWYCLHFSQVPFTQRIYLISVCGNATIHIKKYFIYKTVCEQKSERTCSTRQLYIGVFTQFNGNNRKKNNRIAHSEQEMTSSSCRSHYIFNSSLNYVIIKNWRELCFLSRGNLIFSIFVVGCYQIVSGT